MLSSPTKSKPIIALAARPTSPSRPRSTVVVPPKSVADWILPVTTTSDLPLRPAAVPNVDADAADRDDDDDTELVGYADEAAEMQGILAAMAAEFDAADSTDPIPPPPATIRGDSGTSAASDVTVPRVHRSAPAGPWSTHLSTAPADLDHTFWHEVDRADWIISLALRAAFPHAYAGTEGGAEGDEGDEDEVDSDPDEEAKKKKDDEEKTVPISMGLSGFPLLDVPDAALDALERVLGEGVGVAVATEPVPT